MIATEPSVCAEIADGDCMSLVELARQFDLNPSTCLRWILTGLPDEQGNRIKLEAVRRGKPWLTSKAALQRFLQRLPQSDGNTAPAPEIRTPSKRQRDTERAQQTLKDQYGID